MKRTMLGCLIVAAVALVPNAAYAAADTSTETEQNATSSWTLTICEDPYDATLTFNSVSHSTTVDGGITEVRVNVSGTLVAVPQDGIGPTYSGRYQEAFGFQNKAKSGSFTWPIEIILFGSDGSMLREHMLLHLNQSASGLEFEVERDLCSSVR